MGRKKAVAAPRVEPRVESTNLAEEMGMQLEHQIAVVTTKDPDVEFVQESERAGNESVEPTSDERKLEAKIEHLQQLCKTQESIIEALMSKGTKKSSYHESSGTGDLTFRSLFMDSQKKVEALTEENHELKKKLEFALGKIEAYEKENPMVASMFEKLKELLLFSSLTKATEAVANASAEAIRGTFAAANTSVGLEPMRSSPKRKRAR